MEKQTSSLDPFKIVPLWMRFLLGILSVLVVIGSVLRHGFGNWAWFSPIVGLGILFFPIDLPYSRNSHWIVRVLTCCGLWDVALGPSIGGDGLPL